ncbi:MAG: hypothetical protein ACRDAM_09760, partial [Casimicrobium sp.]
PRGADDSVPIVGVCTRTFGGTVRRTCAARFTADGARDTLFGNNGATAISPLDLTSNAVLTYAAMQPDGKLTIAETCFFGSGSTGTNDICSSRFDSDGARDGTYIGYPIGVPTGIRNSARGIAINRDGIYIVGDCTGANDLCVRRYEGGPYGATQCSPDIDGDGRVTLDVDSRLLLRASLGFTGTVVTQGVVFNFALSRRTTWAAIREYLNSQCGMALAP